MPRAPVTTPPASAAFDDILSVAKAQRGPAPVHLWNPAFCGAIDMRIARDGSWHYNGTPIGRMPLVKLFSTVLKREGDAYFLVTPVEKLAISVEDVPFLAVEMRIEPCDAGERLVFRTNVDEVVVADEAHPLRFERGDDAEGGVVPYLKVRADLWARATRTVMFDLVARSETRDVAGEAMLGVASGTAFFPIAPADAVEGLT